MFRRVAQAFDLAAALGDVAKGLKKKMEDITWAAAIGEIRAAHSITRIHTQTIMSALRLPFHHVLPVYHLHRLPIAIPPHRIACKRCWLVLGLWHPKAPILIQRLLYNVEGFSFFVGGTMLHSRLLFQNPSLFRATGRRRILRLSCQGDRVRCPGWHVYIFQQLSLCCSYLWLQDIVCPNIVKSMSSSMPPRKSSWQFWQGIGTDLMASTT